MTNTTPDWQLYEREIHEELQSKYPDAVVTHNVKVPGCKSGVSRQIDILVEERTPGGMVSTAVEAKYHARAIAVKDVEAFIGLLNDVAIGRGVMIAPRGYSEAAFARAYRDDVDVDLDVFTLDEFKAWQADLAIPFAGRNGILMPAPFGWAVDFRGHQRALAWLYQRGRTFEQAWQLPEANVREDLGSSPSGDDSGSTPCKASQGHSAQFPRRTHLSYRLRSKVRRTDLPPTSRNPVLSVYGAHGLCGV
jgi:hypothetical protein